MVMPARTRRVHFKHFDPRCDQIDGIRRAARRPPGQRYVDLNVVPAADGDVNLHWVDGPRKNHYRYIVDAKTNRVRRMTRAEQRRPVFDWSVDGVLRWRRRRRASSRRPATVAQRQAQAKRFGVVICWEVKSRAYVRPDLARRLVQAVQRSGHTGYFMTLMSMRDWAGKGRAIGGAGGEIALLSHGKMRGQRVPVGFTRIWN